MSALEVISPATTTIPVLARVSQATRLCGSLAISASRMASEIWSHILSGCPSDTDSEVKKKSFKAMKSLRGERGQKLMLVADQRSTINPEEPLLVPGTRNG